MSKKCEQGFEVDGGQSPRPFGGRHSVSVNAYPALLTQPFTATGPKHPSRFRLFVPNHCIQITLLLPTHNFTRSSALSKF